MDGGNKSAMASQLPIYQQWVLMTTDLQQSSQKQGSAMQHLNMTGVCLLNAFPAGLGKEAAVLLHVQAHAVS